MDNQEGIEMSHCKSGPVGIHEGQDSDSMQEQDVHKISGSHNANLPAPHLDVRPYLLADDSL